MADGSCTCLYVHHTYAHAFCFLLVDFDVKTRERELTPLLVAASYNRKNAVLWLLQDGREKITEDAVDTDGRNAIHLASLDLQCQYTIEVSLISEVFIA